MHHRRLALASGYLGTLLSVPLGANVPAGVPAAAPGVATPAATPALTPEALTEVVVQAAEPRYVAPTRRDRIGRIWAPVLIGGKGPYRLVLDTGANRSAITASTAQALGTAASPDSDVRVTGFTGTAIVPIVRVSSMEVGDVAMGPRELPVLADVFGGAQGVLGIDGLAGKRIYADFTRDYLEIARSRSERAPRGFGTVPLHLTRGGLLVADVRVGHVDARAIIDTGAQGTIGNLALREALMRHPPRDAVQSEVIGVTLDVQKGDIMPSPDITMGGLTISGIRVTFGDMYLFQRWHMTDTPTLTLGMDLLGSFDVLVIDYGRRELQIRLRGTSPRGAQPS
ncbi:MAG: aspartyl protease family protein [Proteobacteria bacterium]|nr:aspartyl protease family protein [Pseudomonadota bacterium]